MPHQRRTLPAFGSGVVQLDLLDALTDLAPDTADGQPSEPVAEPVVEPVTASVADVVDLPTRAAPRKPRRTTRKPGTDDSAGGTR